MEELTAQEVRVVRHIIHNFCLQQQEGTGETLNSVVLQAQSSAPAAPTSGVTMFAPANNQLAWRGVDTFTRTFAGTLTGNHTYTWPNADGTVALTSDLSSGYLPLSGGTLTGLLKTPKLIVNSAVDDGVNQLQVTGNSIFSGNIKSGNYSEFLQGNGTRSIYGGAFVLTRSLTNAGTNPHGFDENSTLNASGGVAMNAFGVHSIMTGNYNYDHFNGFQCYPTISNTGTLTNLTDFGGAPNIINTAVTTRTGVSVGAAALSGGASIVTQYGIRIDGMANATNNWAIFTNSPTKNFLGGPTQINYSSPVTATNPLEVNGSIRATSYSNSTGVVLGGGFGAGYGGVYIIGGTPYSEIQSIQEGVGYTDLVLQKLGGNVGIKTTTPTHSLTFGSTSTGWSHYNTTNLTTDYERVRGYWTGGGVYTIASENLGAGGFRQIQLLGAGHSITLGGSSGNTMDFVLPTSATRLHGFTYNTTVNSSSLFQNQLSVYPTIAQSGTAGYSLISAIAYEQSTGSGSKYLLRLATSTAANGGGTLAEKFSVSNTGSVAAQGNVSGNAGDFPILFDRGSGIEFRLGNNTPTGKMFSTGRWAFGGTTDDGVSIANFTGAVKVQGLLTATSSAAAGLFQTSSGSVDVISLQSTNNLGFSTVGFLTNTGVFAGSFGHSNSNGSGFIQLVASYRDMVFYTSGTAMMTLKQSNNVLIGTTTDDTANKLQVNGKAKFTDVVSIPVAGLQSANGGLYIGTGATFAGNADNLFTVRGTGSSTALWRGRIVAGGDNVAFLMGEYNSQAWLGAHNATLSAWAPLFIQAGGSNVIIGGTGDDGVNRLQVNGSIKATGDIVPASNNTYNLGSSILSQRYANVYTLAVRSENILEGYSGSNISFAAWGGTSYGRMYSTGRWFFGPSPSDDGTSIVNIGGAAKISGTLSLQPSSVNVDSITFYNSSYGIGMNISDMLLWATSTQGISFMDGSRGGTLRTRFLSNGQIGVGTGTPNASALIDMVSTTKGFMPPRMTTTEKNAIPVDSTRKGLVVVDTTLNKLCFYNGSAWETVTSS